MRHCWACDIADFAKYALLRRLAGGDLRLGVLWYLTIHAVPNPPLAAYLSRPDNYRVLDGALFDALSRLRAARGPLLSLADIERGDVLPHGTVFYTEPLSTTVLDRPLRAAARQRWFEDGCARTRSCDLVFLDPDTGILPAGHKTGKARGEEFATLEEVISLGQRGQSVVCVQFGRPGNLEPEPHLARQRLAELRDALTAHGLPQPWGVWWQDTHKVGMLVAPSSRHDDMLRGRIDDVLADSVWSAKLSIL